MSYADDQIDHDVNECNEDELYGGFDLLASIGESRLKPLNKGRIESPGTYPLRVKNVPHEPKAIAGAQGAISMQLTLEIDGMDEAHDGKTVKMFLNLRPNSCEDPEKFNAKTGGMVRLLVKRLRVMMGDKAPAQFTADLIKQAVGYKTCGVHLLHQRFMARLERDGDFLRVEDIWAIPNTVASAPGARKN